jgi:hypothetical protein
MQALGKFLQVNNTSDPRSQTSYVENLTQRISESALIEDRREAIFQLRDVMSSPVAQQEFGNSGFPVLLAVLRDREELDMVRAALEAIQSAVYQDPYSKVQVSYANSCTEGYLGLQEAPHRRRVGCLPLLTSTVFCLNCREHQPAPSTLLS